MSSTMLKVIFIFAFICASVNSQAPTVKIMQTDPPSFATWYLQAEQDTDVTMDCYVENLPSDTTVRWQRTVATSGNSTSALVYALSQDMALEDNIHYSIEKPTQFTWRLRIRAIQTSDMGTYQCFVLTTLNSRASDQRIITVVVTPTIDHQQTSSDSTVTQGDNLDLTCNATGLPFPVIEWTRLGGKLLPIGQEALMGSLLSLKNIQPGDRGVYKCQAMNSVGTDEVDITLTVRFAPVITVPRPIINQAVGYRVELQCFATANPIPRTTDMTWVFGSTTYSVSSQGYAVRFTQGAFNQLTYELIIYNVQPSNYGNYVCRMKNDVGSTTQTITLAKADTPQASVKVGQIIKGAATAPTASCLLLTFALALMRLLAVRTD